MECQLQYISWRLQVQILLRVFELADSLNIMLPFAFVYIVWFYVGPSLYSTPGIYMYSTMYMYEHVVYGEARAMQEGQAEIMKIFRYICTCNRYRQCNATKPDKQVNS